MKGQPALIGYHICVRIETKYGWHHRRSHLGFGQICTFQVLAYSANPFEIPSHINDF